MCDKKRLDGLLKMDLLASISMIPLAIIAPDPMPTRMVILFIAFLVAHTALWVYILVACPEYLGTRGAYRRLWLDVRRRARMALMRCEHAAIRFCVFLGACRFGSWLEDRCMHLHRNIELQWGEEWFAFADGTLEHSGTDWRWRRSSQWRWSLYQGDKNRGSVFYDKDGLTWMGEVDGDYYTHMYTKSARETANAVEAMAGVWTEKKEGG